MQTIYVLWHTQRQGWMTTNGTTSTEWAVAWQMTREEAFSMAERQISHDGTPALLPIRLADMNEVLG